MNLATKDCITIDTFTVSDIVNPDGTLTDVCEKEIYKQWDALGKIKSVRLVERGIKVSFDWGWYTPTRLILTR